MRVIGRPRLRWRIAASSLAVVVALGATAVWTNALGAGDRFDRLMARVEAFVDPPPRRETLPTVVVTPQPTVAPLAAPARAPGAPPEQQVGGKAPTPAPTPTPLPVRAPVDMAILADHAAVFSSQLTTDDCAVAGTQMVLTVLGLGNASGEFQQQIKSRIGEWESWDDSHNGGWGPAAVSLALAAYGAPGYEIRAYATRGDALRDAAIALEQMGMPVVLFPWWGAHTWVMTGYTADANPAIFPDATVTGAYILDPWYPRVSSIWGPSDPPGTYQDAAEMERNFIGWTRPEGPYPGRDGMYVVLIPTLPPGS